MKPYNKEKPAFQTNILAPDWAARAHPGLSEVEIHLTTEQAADNINANEIQRGADMVFYGIIIAIACAVAHGVIKSSYPALKPFSKFFEWGIVGGVYAIIGGMLLKNIVQYELWILLAACVCSVGYLLYRFRDWSVSHLFKKRKPTT